MGRIGKLKSGSKGKLNQWKKGQSSSSNPQSKTYREKARGKFFQMQPTSRSNKGLTLEAVKIHDEIHDSQASPMSYMEDSASEGGQTFATFLSGISDCDNVTFKKIKRYWENNSAKHKEVCAVLAAITEVIRQNNGLESDTAYFATLITALGTVESTDSLAAVAYLLSLTCKRVPEAVLRSKFSEVSKLLVDTLMQSSKLDGSPTALIRSLLMCLATILQKQDLQTWSDASTMNVYQTLLSFSVYTKPKIRKAAQNGICAVLKASSFMSKDEFHQDSIQHPAAVSTAKFFAQIIEKSGSVTKESSSTTCHVISLMGEILHCFPPASLKRSCELILKLMTLSQHVVKSVGLQALYRMFKNQPKASILSAEMNAQIMTALYDYLPPANDSQPTQAWTVVMNEAAQNLTNIFKNCPEQQKIEVEQLVLGQVTKLCKTCLKIMESANRPSCQAAANTFKDLLRCCVCPIKESADESNLLKSTVLEIFKLLERGLKFKFHSVWDLIFDLYAVAYKLLAAPRMFLQLKGGLTSMADLRNTPHFLHKMALDKALGAAAETLGPCLILQAIPLMIDGTETDYDFPRSWMLPLLKDHIKNTELGFFLSYFLPLAAKLRMRALQLKATNQDAAANPYDTLQYQIWLLLPGFCDGATDLSTSFPTLARTIGTAITEREDLRMLAMQALRTVLMKCTREEDKQTISRFAKNYLPILFNLYIDTPTGKSKMQVDNSFEGDDNKKKSPERLASLETLRLYLPFADEELVASFFTRAQQRVFDGAEEKDATRLALLDLLIAMVVHVTAENLSLIYQNMLPMLKSPNHSMQKKAYRLFEEILESRSAQCKEFVEIKLEEIKSLLSDGLTSASPSAKGPRLKCMESVFRLLAVKETYTAEECMAYMQELIPEVIMCTREKKRARQAAFNLLVTAGNMYCEIAVRNADEEKEKKLRKVALAEYFQIVFAGLGGSPVTITSAICALSRLVYEYKDIMSSELLNDCISNVCLLLGTNTREVCKAALGFVTVLLTILDRATLAQHVRQVLDALFNWKSQTRRHFRFRVKKMLERFVKKFDYETIYSMVPPEHHKQLANLKKTRERQNRKKLENYENKPEREEMEIKTSKPESIEELLADSSGSDDEKTIKRKGKAGKKSIGSTWLQDSQEEPMDLLDHSVSQRILSTNPNSKIKAKSRKEEFKSADDGRLIIGEEAGNEDEDIENTFASLGIKREKSATATTASKRKIGRKEDSEDDEEESSYKPGGKGIHRIPGEIYKAKRAKGDVKRKGMPDPYAYVPLDRGLLNKRKQKKLTGQFHGLVKAAKHGAVKGKKLKQKDTRKGKSGKG